MRIFCAFVYAIFVAICLIFAIPVLLKRREGDLIIVGGGPSVTIVDCGQLATCSEEIWTVENVTPESVEQVFESVLGDLTDDELSLYFPANVDPEDLTDEELVDGFKQSLDSKSPEQLL